MLLLLEAALLCGLFVVLLGLDVLLLLLRLNTLLLLDRLLLLSLSVQ
jgi:hypothetical protein